MGPTSQIKLRGVVCWVSLLFFSFPIVNFANPLTSCDSCQFYVDSLRTPFSLVGNWYFTRKDHPDNKRSSFELQEWTLVKTPQPWKKIYKDGKNFRVGWYRAKIAFAPQLIGIEAVFLIDAYMSRLTVFLDEQEIYHRPGEKNITRYFSIQPIPVRFKITKTEHDFVFRVDTILMTGVYQLPFQIRHYHPDDWTLALAQFWGGEVRLIAAYISLIAGIFYLIVFLKTNVSVYLVASLTCLCIFPFYAAPGDNLIKFWNPETLLLFHYVGFFAFYYHYQYAQIFYKPTPRINRISFYFYILMSVIFTSMGLGLFNLDVFLLSRSLVFIYNVFLGSLGVFMYFKGVLHERPGSRIMFVGGLVFFASGIHDLLLALGIITSIGMIYFGTIVVTGCMLLVVTLQFADTFVENQKLLTNVQQMNFKILAQISILHELNNTTQNLASLMDRRKVFETVSEALRRHVNITRLALFLCPQEEELTLFHLYPQRARKCFQDMLTAQHSILKVVLQKKELIYHPDTSNEKSYAVPFLENEEGAVLCMPLMDGTTVLGILSISGTRGQFKPNSEERQITETLSSFMSITFKNIHLMEGIQESTRMESELKTAAAVQQSFFPKTLPRVSNIEIASFFQSASETGGDWYGFVNTLENTLYVLIGDVTGHGIPAALVTAAASSACGILEELSRDLHIKPSPSYLLRYLNQVIHKAGFPNFLMTFFVASLDLQTGMLTFSNAGHNFPLVVNSHSNKMKALVNVNPRLGDKQDIAFTQSTVQLGIGDLLFFYTDGLIENTNHQREYWSEGHLRRYLKQYGHLPVKELVTNLVNDVFKFYGGWPLDDDMTLVACEIVRPFPKQLEHF
ncbi:SpoIIE family protein phosphatase [Deltaproteobacteria bacterium TL4]